MNCLRRHYGKELKAWPFAKEHCHRAINCAPFCFVLRNSLFVSCDERVGEYRPPDSRFEVFVNHLKAFLKQLTYIRRAEEQN